MLVLSTAKTVVAPTTRRPLPFPLSPSRPRFPANFCTSYLPLGWSLPSLHQSKLFCTARYDSRDGRDDPSTHEKSLQSSPWSLDAELDKVLLDEESQTLLKDLQAAAERVAAAKRQLEDLDKLQKSRETGATARMQRLEAADSMVAECQRDVFAAEAAVKMAEIALVKARAGRSARDISEKWETEGIDEDSERVESGKAASVCALVGTLASLPWSLAMMEDTGLELIVRSGLVFASCALFGITYRYAVGRNLGNTQLKAGCTAAFAIVRGLGQIDAAKMFWGLPEGPMQKLLTACSIFGEGFAIFFSAAVILDYCFQQGYVSPFPSLPE